MGSHIWGKLETDMETVGSYFMTGDLVLGRGRSNFKGKLVTEAGSCRELSQGEAGD